jgi:hypothetical protein
VSGRPEWIGKEREGETQGACGGVLLPAVLERGRWLKIRNLRWKKSYHLPNCNANYRTDPISHMMEPGLKV